MRGTRDNEVLTVQDSTMKIVTKISLGDREEQQDCFGMYVSDGYGCSVVCDGMGGYEGGKIASETAVQFLLNELTALSQEPVTPQKLTELMIAADRKVVETKGQSTKLRNAGSTCVFVVVQDMKLYWCSVGDSRAYIYRNGKYIQITHDQNYKTVLDEQLRNESITRGQYDKEIVRGSALINYLGIGDMELVDYNTQPFALRSGDKIVIMSDGVYKYASEEEIFRIADNFKDAEEMVEAIENRVKKNVREMNCTRDNMTISVMAIG